MRRLLPLLLLSFLSWTGLAQAADLSRKQRNALEEVQTAYSATLRWGSIEEAMAYLDPEQTKANPISEFQLRRYEQVRVSGYRERGSLRLPDGSIERRVEVGIINVNTQAERNVGVVERWRWDEAAKRWWQSGGLPDYWKGQ